MKVALVHQPWNDPTPPVESGSIAIWIDRVAARLAREHGVEVVVYGRNRSGGWQEETRDGVTDCRVPLGADPRVLRWLQRLPSRPGRPSFASSWYFRTYTRNVARDAAARGCDVVHLFNFPQTVPVVRAKNRAAKIVLHMQCEWLAQLDRAVIRRQIETADALVGCSDFVTRSTVAAFPDAADRCHTVYNGVDTDTFVGQQRTEREGPQLVFVGRVSPEKGVHVLLDAFEIVLREHPNARLRIVGPPAEAPSEFMVFPGGDPVLAELFGRYGGSYLPALDQRAAALGAERVEFSRSVPHSELSPLFADADVAVVPSIWQEPFGMIVAEAMSCETPVVASRVGGIPEIIVDGETGILVERSDPAALAAALLEVLGDADFRASAGPAGRARAVELFAWDRIAAATRALYAELGN